MDNLERYITTEARRFIDEEEKNQKTMDIKYKLNNDDISTNKSRKAPAKKNVVKYSINNKYNI